MRSDTIVAIGAVLASLLTAGAGAWVAIRKEGRDGAVATKQEVRALRNAWLWSVRTITRLLSFIARTDGIELPPDWKIQQELEMHEKRISGDSEETVT